MLKISELAMPKSRKATIVCNSRRDVWKTAIFTTIDKFHECILNEVLKHSRTYDF